MVYFQCSKSFSAKETLNRHNKTHTGTVLNFSDCFRPVFHVFLFVFFIQANDRMHASTVTKVSFKRPSCDRIYSITPVRMGYHASIVARNSVEKIV